jgi:hypothetical protein
VRAARTLLGLSKSPTMFSAVSHYGMRTLLRCPSESKSHAASASDARRTQG